MRAALSLFAAAAAFAVVISCASPPKPAPEPVPAPAAPAAPAAQPAPAPEKPSVPAPDDQRSKASELRKKAFDLGIKDVLPADYAAADDSFSAGNAQYGKDNAAAAASFDDASAKFQAAIDKGLPLLAKAAHDRANGLRATAVGKKAGDLFPGLFAFAEADLAKHAGEEKAGDFETAIQGFKVSAREYEVLYKLCDANAARQTIVARDFAKWDPSNWSLAETAFKASQDLLKTDANGAATSVDEAILRYGIATQTAREYYAGDRRKSSEDAMARASSIKAQVAVKDEFAAAQALYDQAAAAQAAKDYDGAAGLFDKAGAAFSSAYTHAKVKMDKAKGELDSLDEAIAAKQAAGR